MLTVPGQLWHSPCQSDQGYLPHAPSCQRGNITTGTLALATRWLSIQEAAAQSLQSTTVATGYTQATRHAAWHAKHTKMLNNSRRHVQGTKTMCCRLSHNPNTQGKGTVLPTHIRQHRPPSRHRQPIPVRLPAKHYTTSGNVCPAQQGNNVNHKRTTALTELLPACPVEKNKTRKWYYFLVGGCTRCQAGKVREQLLLLLEINCTAKHSSKRGKKGL